MLSGETVVGGVELKDAEFDKDMSVGVLLEKLDVHSSESSSAIVGAASVAAIVAAGAVGLNARQNLGVRLCKMASGMQECKRVDGRVSCARRTAWTE